MAKRKAESQTASLTPDHKKSGIDPIYLAADNVRHTLGKPLTRATTLLQTEPQFKVFSQSYGASKSRESQLAQCRDSHLGVPREKSHLDVGPVESCRVYYKGEGDGFPPSSGRGESCVSVLPVVCPSTKGAVTMH